MWSREKRLLVLALVVAGGVFGGVLEPLLDPLESRGLAWVGMVAGMSVFGGAVGYWWNRRFEAVEDPDERHQAIERRAARLGYGTLFVGVAALATVLLFPLELPVAPLLWGLLVGSLAVHELSIEYYRRRM